MNYYAVPDFLAAGIIVLVSVTLRRFNRQTRFHYWSLGWIVLLGHTILHVVNIENGRWQIYQDAATMLTISVASVIFLGAAASLDLAKMRWLILASLPNLVYIVCWNSSVQAPKVYFALIAAGFLSSLLFMTTGGFRDAGLIVPSRIFVAGAYGVQALLLSFVSLDFSGQWLLSWPFLLVAYLFWHDATKKTTGVVVTSFSFLLWASVFPLAEYFQTFHPEIHVESEIWNMPKFLAACGMLLTLVEEQMGRMTQLAMCDELTGLANRRAYMGHVEEALERSRRGSGTIALLVIDLNDFKAVNDTVGHHGGDELLREISRRLGHGLRPNAILARVGGDEFAVVLEGSPSRSVVEDVIEMLHESLAEPIWVRGEIQQISASIGAAFYPEDGDSHDSLYALADMNMYQMKHLDRAVLPLA